MFAPVDGVWAVRVWGAVGVGLLGSGVSGLSQCRVAAFNVSGLHESDFLFITVSHCAWRHVIFVQSDKETKQRKRFQNTLP